MKNSIPERYLFSCELFRSVERRAMADYGKISPEVLQAIIVQRMNSEDNAILQDLYWQMLKLIRQKSPDMASADPVH